MKLIYYFNGKKDSTGILFPEKTHSNSEVEQNSKGDFQGYVFLSQGKTNSCGV